MSSEAVSGCEHEKPRTFAVSESFERAAAQGLPMPPGLDGPQQRLYIQLRGVYRDHHDGLTTRLQAAAEKAKAVQEYERDPVRAFVGAVRDTEEARRQYHIRENAGAGTEELLALAKRIIYDATGDGTFR